MEFVRSLRNDTRFTRRFRPIHRTSLLSMRSHLWTEAPSTGYTSDVLLCWLGWRGGKGTDMHLMRLGGTGEEKPVVRADDGTLYDISGLTGDIDGAFLAGDGITRVSDALAAGTLPVVDDPA